MRDKSIKKRLCFIAPHAYKLLVDTGCEFAGGAELQQILIAQRIVDFFDVIFLVAGHAGDRRQEYAGKIKIIKVPASFTGGKCSYVRTLWVLFVALWRADADVYCLRAPSYLLGLAGLFCMLRSRKLIFSMAIDYESDPKSLTEQLSWISRTLFIWGLRNTHMVVTQTDSQQFRLRKNFDINSVKIKNVYVLPRSGIDCKRTEPPCVLWVGTAAAWKRPHLFLDLARSLPDIKFSMIMAPGLDAILREQIIAQAQTISNLDYIGFVAPAKITSYYARAAVLVNTSLWEGFPNTFLQAWGSGTPVVSLAVDPDNTITSNNLGFCSGTMTQMQKDIRVLLNDPLLRATYGDNARNYVLREHSPEHIIREWIRIVDSII
jgi:glycosyltransferase involved in cell wall biosynthesis